MRLKRILAGMMIVMLIACTGNTPEKTLSTPGFGVVETRIAATAGEVEIPILLKTTDVIKGLQFTLVWDKNQVRVGEPLLTETNPGFTVSTGNGRQGRMKVLVFSMTGEEMNTSDPEILKLPVRVVDPQAQDVMIQFDKAVFAGPHAKSYAIPVSNAQLKVTAS